MELYTIGYEGRTVPELIAVLTRHAITRVIDVRELPLSRRKGMSKTALAASLAAADIDYVHLRSAGNPFRKSGGLTRYRTYLTGAPDVVDLVADTARDHRAALLCVERDPAQCHRLVLAAEVMRRHAGTTIANL